ncbi:2-amino-4-hydroxy-6-hydroxymethyldihydropteridine diphosphokinase [Alsobacter metallidurans]|uniref:2-amino-4-hydroxy-6-hydroxymethyldihydropteridine pyrophosphokinase n=1 Tax=Alsobacter metallidurans TaxID=340221 RepID=A0A917IB97_9HYPH|nr:2-amino-4-hydroxy-6-hydroxymethyldihydropteridine diphosphokinase [Alsobacter metallidurans]GGH33148.1 2-amino-4-hydroxy-6-hydroxymethyldihydropteridine diphosphokinase [Alsobacter metallidurans]
MARAWVSLGGNIGRDAAAKRAAIAEALRRLDTGKVRVIARSGDYRTPPWGPVAQDWFVNACAEIETELRPRELLDLLLGIEHAMGRVRNERWGPRLIDMDILAYEAVTVESPDLTLPHPRMMDRAFVLVPLAEISPDLLIGETSIAHALARLDSSGIERLR